MLKKNFSTTLLPVLGVLLALILAGATALYWQQPGDATRDTAMPALGRLVALVQSARADSAALLAGDDARFAALARSRAELDLLRQSIQRAPGASAELRGLANDAALWSGITQNLDEILDGRALLGEIDQARTALAELLPELLAATATMASGLPGDVLAANQSQLTRFELTVEAIQQQLRALGDGGSGVGVRLGDAEQLIGQILRGLRGQDTGLGVVPVTGAEASRL